MAESQNSLPAQKHTAEEPRVTYFALIAHLAVLVSCTLSTAAAADGRWANTQRALVIQGHVRDVWFSVPFVPGVALDVKSDGKWRTFIKTSNDRSAGSSEAALKLLLQKHLEDLNVDNISVSAKNLCEFYSNKFNYCKYTESGLQRTLFLHSFRLRYADYKTKIYEKTNDEYLIQGNIKARYFLYEDGKKYRCIKRVIYSCEYNIVLGDDVLFSTQFSMRFLDDAQANTIMKYADQFLIGLSPRMQK